MRDNAAMDVTREFVAEGLKRAHYVTNERVETAVFLALALTLSRLRDAQN